MKTVYSAPNLPLVSIMQNLLESRGIRCWLRNQYLSAGMGDLPPIECWPQLCVDDEDAEEAAQLIAEALKIQHLPPWKCHNCGEELEGQFTECWNCGRSRQ